MRVLLHICCGPCAIMPIKRLLDEGHELSGFFYNPNIHPLAEYLRRREGAAQVAERYGIKMYWAVNEFPYETGEAGGAGAVDEAGAVAGAVAEAEAGAAVREGYNTAAWLEGLREACPSPELVNSPARCAYCWPQRLARAFELARREGFEAVTSSLLYSRRQRHEEIAAAGRALEAGEGAEMGKAGPLFLYRDFRPDWQAGINLSKEWGIYRQQYCGCIFSESDRYARDLAKADAALATFTSGPEVTPDTKPDAAILP